MNEGRKEGEQCRLVKTTTSYCYYIIHPYQVRNSFDNEMYCSSLMTTGRMDVLMLDLNQVVGMDF
jgi:hypothetical protein